MRDPLPIPVPAWLANAVLPVADYLSLPTLPLHIHELLATAIFYHVIQTRISPWLSPKLFPKTYPALSARTKLNWDVHVVALVQSVVVCAVSLYVMLHDEERRHMTRDERVWGYTGGLGLVQAMGLGYFFWDLYITVTNLGMFGLGMLAHAVSAVAVYSFGFRPFTNYYTPDFLLFELSSPFLNIHWFCDKLGMTGSTLQMINGILLIVVFALCRLAWGTYASISMLKDIFSARRDSLSWDIKHSRAVPATDPSIIAVNDIMRFAGNHEAPLWLILSNLASTLTLQFLNWFWMKKMIGTIRKRFDAPFGTRKPQDKTRDNVAVSTGAQANGHKGVEIEATSVQRRPVAERMDSDLPIAA